MKDAVILEELKKLHTLITKQKSKPLNAVQAAEYLSISLQHLYRLTSQRKIPFHKPMGRYIYFFSNELDEWIAGDGKIQDNKTQDIEDEEEEPP